MERLVEQRTFYRNFLLNYEKNTYGWIGSSLHVGMLACP